MEVQVAVAKIEKYATGESGDTVEVVERPHGGISVVMVDGQRSGRSAKTISNLVARKAISLLGEGVRDGAAARASHDYLRTHRSGKVSAELVIVSADLESGTLVISRNTQTPVLVHRDSVWQMYDAVSEAVGIHARTRPAIEEIPLHPGVVAIAFSDGVWRAGERYGTQIDLLDIVQSQPLTLGARAYADELLSQAFHCEQNRPTDDLTVVVLRVSAIETDSVRRMAISLPVPSVIHGKWAEER